MYNGRFDTEGRYVAYGLFVDKCFYSEHNISSYKSLLTPSRSPDDEQEVFDQIYESSSTKESACKE